MDNLYNRQEDIDLNLPTEVAIIGLGGVGSWVALNFALLGTPQLYLFDFDYIEKHNLNRTPYRLNQVNDNKAKAMAELIYERREDIDIFPFQDKFGSSHIDVVENSIVIDCKDNLEDLPGEIKSPIIGGYDGKSITLHTNPNYDSIWGEGSETYQVTPSYLVPPQFIAAMITGYITSPKLIENSEERTYTANFSEIFNKIME